MIKNYIGGVIIAFFVVTALVAITIIIFNAICKKHPNRRWGNQFIIIATVFSIGLVIRLVLYYFYQKLFIQENPELSVGYISFCKALYTEFGGFTFGTTDDFYSDVSLFSSILQIVYSTSLVWTGLVILTIVTIGINYEIYSYFLLLMPERNKSIYIFTALTEDTIALAESISLNKTSNSCRIIFSGPNIPVFDKRNPLCSRIRANGFLYWSNNYYFKTKKVRNDKPLIDILHVNNHNSLLRYKKVLLDKTPVHNNMRYYRLENGKLVFKDNDKILKILEELKNKEDQKKSNEKGENVFYELIEKKPLFKDKIKINEKYYNKKLYIFAFESNNGLPNDENNVGFVFDDINRLNEKNRFIKLKKSFKKNVRIEYQILSKRDNNSCSIQDRIDDLINKNNINLNYQVINIWSEANATADDACAKFDQEFNTIDKLVSNIYKLMNNDIIKQLGDNIINNIEKNELSKLNQYRLIFDFFKTDNYNFESRKNDYLSLLNDMFNKVIENCDNKYLLELVNDVYPEFKKEDVKELCKFLLKERRNLNYEKLSAVNKLNDHITKLINNSNIKLSELIFNDDSIIKKIDNKFYDIINKLDKSNYSNFDIFKLIYRRYNEFVYSKLMFDDFCSLFGNNQKNVWAIGFGEVGQAVLRKIYVKSATLSFDKEDGNDVVKVTPFKATIYDPAVNNFLGQFELENPMICCVNTRRMIEDFIEKFKVLDRKDSSKLIKIREESLVISKEKKYQNDIIQNPLYIFKNLSSEDDTFIRELDNNFGVQDRKITGDNIKDYKELCPGDENVSDEDFFIKQINTKPQIITIATGDDYRNINIANALISNTLKEIRNTGAIIHHQILFVNIHDEKNNLLIRSFAKDNPNDVNINLYGRWEDKNTLIIYESCSLDFEIPIITLYIMGNRSKLYSIEKFQKDNALKYKYCYDHVSRVSDFDWLENIYKEIALPNDRKFICDFLNVKSDKVVTDLNAKQLYNLYSELKEHSSNNNSFFDNLRNNIYNVNSQDYDNYIAIKEALIHYVIKNVNISEINKFQIISIGSNKEELEIEIRKYVSNERTIVTNDKIDITSIFNKFKELSVQKINIDEEKIEKINTEYIEEKISKLKDVYKTNIEEYKKELDEWLIVKEMSIGFALRNGIEPYGECVIEILENSTDLLNNDKRLNDKLPKTFHRNMFNVKDNYYNPLFIASFDRDKIVDKNSNMSILQFEMNNKSLYYYYSALLNVNTQLEEFKVLALLTMLEKERWCRYYISEGWETSKNRCKSQKIHKGMVDIFHCNKKDISYDLMNVEYALKTEPNKDNK